MLKVDINLLFTVINLFLLFFVIWKFLFKPVKKIIAKRQEEVNAGYAEAEKAKADAEAAKASYEEQLLKAEEEKSEILKDSRIRAAKEYDKIIADAKQSASDLVEKAKKDAKFNALYLLIMRVNVYVQPVKNLIFVIKNVAILKIH